MKLVEYAVRLKGTQKYLPRSQRRDGRGGSHLEPVDFTDRSSWPKGYEKNMQIRTYTTRAAAENLRRSWVQGKFYASRGGGTFDDDYYEDIWCEPVPERQLDKLEVVEITLTLPE
jgi:hypothetical protein